MFMFVSISFFFSFFFLSLPFSRWPRGQGTERTPARPWRTRWSPTEPPARSSSGTRRSDACCSRWLCQILWTLPTSPWRPATEPRRGLCTPLWRWVVRSRGRVWVRSELVSRGRGRRWPSRDWPGRGRRRARSRLWIFFWVGLLYGLGEDRDTAEAGAGVCVLLIWVSVLGSWVCVIVI